MCINAHTKTHTNMNKNISFSKEILAKEEPSEDYKLPIEALIETVSKNWKLGDLHGLKHWQNVHRNAILLMQPGVNPFVVNAFAYLHDCCRISNGNDILHGKRAIMVINNIRCTILKNFSDEEIELLNAACLLHTDVLRTGYLTIDTCFDADRLDLDRIGITPNPHKMATKRGADFASDFINFRIRRSNVEV